MVQEEKKTQQEAYSQEKQAHLQQLTECLRMIPLSLVEQLKACSQEKQAHLQQLIKCLRLIRLSLVKTWCHDHNFSQGMDKSLSQYRDALDVTTSIEAAAVVEKQKAAVVEKQKAAVVEKQKIDGNLDKMIPKIYKQELRSETLQDEVLSAIAEAFEGSKAPKALLKLLLYLGNNSDLLEETTYIQGITAFATHHESWLRSPEEWHLTEDNRECQFSDLARHLFAAYEVPLFMDSVWFKGNETHQNWFKHIGAGQNIRTAPGFPLSLTKKMAHHFLTAPQDYTLEEAFRWGQVHGLGGDTRLANALRGTKLTQSDLDFWRFTDLLMLRDFWGDNNDFWVSVIQFFIANPMLDITHVSPIIDYIWDQKYGDSESTREIGPNQPHFIMKGRTPEALLRRVAEWHDRLGESEVDEKLNWSRSQIGEFSFQEEATEKQAMKLWHIRELLNSAELIEEARAMSHCVASYTLSCHRRFSSIWSMETEDQNGRRKVLTIEVLLPQKRIREVRGKGNRLPTPEEKSIIEKWADQEGLQLARYI